MSEICRLRRIVLAAGIVIVLLNPVYFILTLNLGSSLIRSDSAYGRFLFSGVLLGAFSLLCGVLGKGPHRWKVVVGAGVETFLWWFMAVGG
jgi:hypothetical protein